MKTLIIYYSRTGSTKIVAEKLKTLIEADMEEIKARTDYSGLIGYLRAGRETMKKIIPEIEELKFDPSLYDLVIVGTPVWVGTMASPIRSYLEKNKGKIKKAAWFTTQGSRQRQKVFDEMTAVCGQPAIGELFIATKEARSGNFEEKLKKYITDITNHAVA